jgi:hypothetical protein
MKRREFVKKSFIITAALNAVYCGTKKKDKIKVILLGFDGANWSTLDPLIEKGKLPFLKKLKEESAWAYFKTFKPAKSNVVWTSIASGKTMLKHGIVDFVYLKKNGLKVPYSKSDRREPLIWQILDEHKKRSAVLNWWCSHPPDKINGVMASDFLRRMATSKPEIFHKFVNAVHPVTYYKKFKELALLNNDYLKIVKKTGLPDFDGLYKKNYPGKDISKVPVIKSYKAYARHDAYIEEVSRHLLKNEDVDFFATYFRFPDVIQHFITLFLNQEYKENLKKHLINETLTREMNDEAVLKISDLLEPVYRYMENIIKDYMEIERKKNKNTYFFIMSDHGFSLFRGGYNHYGLPDNMKAPDGFLLINGPKVRQGMIKDAGVFDITPTILNLYDLPVGKNMDGRVLSEVFQLHRTKRFKTYKLKKEGEKERDKTYDEETLNDLKSIGYINK